MTLPTSSRIRIFRIPSDRINWTTSSFLIGTFVLTLTAVPLYLWYFGVDWFQVAVFAVLLASTGFSVTLGYHRLFLHMTFRAKLPVRLFALIFGAAAFENSVLMWASDHRRHHKHVDHDQDPYDITKGFFHAYIGWLLFKLWPQPPFDNVADLKKDPLVMWQHRHIHSLAVLVGFGLPTLIGFLWDAWLGALGGFLIGASQKLSCFNTARFSLTQPAIPSDASRTRHDVVRETPFSWRYLHLARATTIITMIPARLS